jgi:GTP-binding protein
MRTLVDLALEPLNLPDPEEEAEPQQIPHHPPGCGGPPQRGEIHADQHLAGRRAPGRLRPAGHDPRHHFGAFRAGGQKFELIDTAGLRRKGKVFEAIEKFSVVKTCRPSKRQRRAAAAGRDPGRDRPGRAHRRLHPGKRPRRWCWPSTSGTRSIPTSAKTWSAPSKRGWVSSSSPKSIHLGHQAPGPGPGLEVHRAGPHASANRKMSTPVLTRLLLEAVQFQQPQRSGVFRPSCVMRTRAA